MTSLQTLVVYSVCDCDYFSSSGEFFNMVYVCSVSLCVLCLCDYICARVLCGYMSILVGIRHVVRIESPYVVAWRIRITVAQV